MSSSSNPPSPGTRPHLPLMARAFGLTQLPALPLLLLGRPTPLAFGAYLVSSALAAVALAWVCVAWRRRVDRIVGLVCGFAEDGRLPKGAEGADGSERRVQDSLAALDRVVRSLETDAACDPLTGILNRRTCAARLEGDLARSRRSGVPFSIALFDLDDLKTINDTLGHAAGDDALRHLAGVLSGVVREGDWVARWGGDEFLVGFWAADGPAATGGAQRALARLGESPAMLGDRGACLGVSVGVGQALPDDDATRLFARADAALLEAKRAGRGRVTLS